MGFKDNWITYLESLDFEGADEEKLETLINNGEKRVETIQSIVPLFNSLNKGKLTFKDFRAKINGHLSDGDTSHEETQKSEIL